MRMLDFEVGDDRPLVPIAGPCARASASATQEPTRSAAAPGRALGAMKARWYAAINCFE
jgi:hypothetical protein